MRPDGRIRRFARSPLSRPLLLASHLHDRTNHHVYSPPPPA